ncbi:MAG: MFS transporter [Solobacterium sp.]|nr:MFS transporter [Solobacterium sp.]
MYQERKGPTAKYAVLQAGYWIDYLILFSFAAVFLSGRGFTTGQIGTVTAGASILCMVIQQFSGTIADKSKTITVKTISMIFIVSSLFCVCALKFLPAKYLPTAVFYTIALSLQAAFSPILSSLSLEFTNNGYDINFGLARSIGSLGYALCANFMGTIVEANGPEIILPIYIGVYAIELIVLWLFPRPEKLVGEMAKAQEEPSSVLQFLKKYKRFLTVMASFILMFFPMFIMNTYMIYYVRYFGGGESEMGRALFLNAMTEIPMMLVSSRIMKKAGADNMLKVAGIFICVKMILIRICPSITFFVLLHLTGLFIGGLFNVSAVFYINSIVGDKDVVKAQAMFGLATSGLCGTLANYFGGMMLEHFTIPTVATVGVISSISGLLVLLVATDPKRFAGEPLKNTRR